jgi:hypothetical protein
MASKIDDKKNKQSGKSSSSPVSRPLSPTRLTELGVLKRFPVSLSGFDPQRGFRHDYQLWITYGHFPHSGNRTVGALKLRKNDPAGEIQKLDIVQSYSNAEEVVHSLTAAVTCRHDRIAQPQEWLLTSEFSNTKDTWKGLATKLTTKYAVEGTTLTVSADGRLSTRKLPGPTSSDWCMFEAIQRMPFDNELKLKFDILEGLSALRPGHRLTYAGEVQHQWGKDAVKLHCFRQFGQGMLPYEYYLDDTHRLVMVVSGYRAYILKGGES